MKLDEPTLYMLTRTSSFTKGSTSFATSTFCSGSGLSTFQFLMLCARISDWCHSWINEKENFQIVKFTVNLHTFFLQILPIFHFQFCEMLVQTFAFSLVKKNSTKIHSQH
jgi:hypothetical protein